MCLHASCLVSRRGEQGHINKCVILQRDLQISLYTTMVAERRLLAICFDYFLTHPTRALGLTDLDRVDRCSWQAHIVAIREACSYLHMLIAFVGCGVVSYVAWFVWEPYVLIMGSSACRTPEARNSIRGNPEQQ